jgi:predicted ATPase with chaperone activity
VEYLAIFVSILTIASLISAMNPCPCGYLGDPSGRCRCTSPLSRQ